MVTDSPDTIAELKILVPPARPPKAEGFGPTY
jgi:hypothetical protein